MKPIPFARARFGSRPRVGLVLGAAAVLAACGGEATPGGGAPATTAATATGTPAAASAPAPAPVGAAPASAPAVPPGPPPDLPANQADASRFLGKATLGATQVEIDELMTAGYAGWIDQHFAKPATSHLSNVAELTATLGETANEVPGSWMQQSFRRAALTGEDPLRQRVAFALSQIVVVSQADPTIGARRAAAYCDILSDNAFGNFRTLLERVSRSPAMAGYLSHLGNRKTDLATGRLPDENDAREIMQRFSIGLYELNPDGTVRYDADGLPVETYGTQDIQGLAKVFTGFSWGGPDTSAARFVDRIVPDSDRVVMPMQGYAAFHETGPKSFLGQTINTSVPADSVSQALDILFQHENVGPFIGRQLIQRLVTSDPSPAYVARVAAAFADNGRGERGDLKAVVRAVLRDPEAFVPPPEWRGVDGRLREPVLRMSVLLRALDARSTSREFRISNTDNPSSSLGQSPMRAPSVFSFCRPGYVAPNSELSRTRLGAMDRVPVAPELQIANEVSVAGWFVAAKALIDTGFGSGSDVKPKLAPWQAIADTPAVLVDRLIVLLASGNQIPTALRNEIIAEVSTIGPATGISTAQRPNRVRLAVLLRVASPDFMPQR